MKCIEHATLLLLFHGLFLLDSQYEKVGHQRSRDKALAFIASGLLFKTAQIQCTIFPHAFPFPSF